MKTAESTIQIRIDTKTKNESRKILEELGLDMSSAVKMFLKNVINTQSIPLDLRTVNGFTVAQEREMIRDTEEAKKNGKRYDNLDELFADLEL
ncbi:MAG: DNA-damage-inducible protein J [Candidatus Azotimanducaceae bacterium]|jgi:DNA-damage-inducible protein J